MFHGFARMSVILALLMAEVFREVSYGWPINHIAVLLPVLSDAIRLHVRLKKRNHSVIGCDDDNEQTVFTW